MLTEGTSCYSVKAPTEAIVACSKSKYNFTVTASPSHVRTSLTGSFEQYLADTYSFDSSSIDWFRKRADWQCSSAQLLG